MSATRPVHDVQYPIHDLLRRRWSPRAFAERPVEREKLQSALEAARWAPSSFNGQPWGFMVATKDDPQEYQRMLACLVPFNQAWAKSAPVLMISVARITFDHNGQPNRHAWYDTGAAVAMMAVEATAQGLYVHQMAGFEPDVARRTYDIPASTEPVSAIAMGYLGEPSELPEDLRKKELAPGQRKSTKDFVFEGRWGNTARVVSA
jgi:nitroreductase